MRKQPQGNRLPAYRCVLLAMVLALPVWCHADWQLVWSDEFEGTNVNSATWAFETGNGSGGWGNNEREYYTNRKTNAYVGDGVLHIVARQESMGGFPYTSARMKSQGLYFKKYGRVEFRARLPQGVGCWPAVWMMGTNISSVGWPACGEIDVMENRGSAAYEVGGALHYSDSSNNHLFQSRSQTLATSVTNFHTYAIEWTNNSIKWVVDSNIIQNWTSWSSSTGPYPAPFNQPFFLLMNLAIGGNYLSNPTDAAVNAGTPFPVEMQVDYVRVFDYVGTAPNAPTGLRVSPGNGQVYLSWDDSSSASGYIIKRGTTPGSYTTVASTVANNYTDIGVPNCATYYYVIVATNSFGASTNSSESAAALGATAWAVNSGGGAAGQFAADAYVVGGTIGAVSSANIDTSGLTSPAPQAVYQAERYGNFTYTFPGLVSGVNYKVRLHSAETYWTAVGQRRFNVIINGTQVLTNFDIIAVAGAANKAVIREFDAVASNGQIVIQYVTVTDNARASGIEIILPQPPAPGGLMASASNSQVSLNWNAVAGATYNVKRAVASGGPFTTVFSGLTNPNCSDLSVTNGVAYSYVVSALILACESTNSVSVNATPACVSPPPPTASNNGPIWAGMTLNLMASTVPGATYRWIGPNGFSSSNQNPVIINADATASGLFVVTAVTGVCTSAPATTTVLVNPPASLTIEYLTGSFKLSWPAGTLQSANTLSGPWSDVSGAISPRTNPVAAGQEFYRLRMQ